MSQVKNQDFWLGSLAGNAAIDKVIASESRNAECRKLYQAMQDTARTCLHSHPKAPIFKAGLLNDHGQSHELADFFVDRLPEDWKRDFRCHTCLRFLRNWGALVCVGSTGDLIPLFWKPDDSIPQQFQGVVEAIASALPESDIKESFDLPANGLIGVREVTKGFRHMHFDFTGARESKRRYLAGHTPASTHELTNMLERVLKDNTQEAVDHAARLLLEDKLPYSDKHKGSIRWLQGLYNDEKIMEKDGIRQRNLIWHFSASSFVGCIHSLRSGAVGELLSWIREGASSHDIERKWKALAGPLVYMRPTAAPKAGNILMAEKLFAELSLTADDMRRAYLTLDQIPDSAFLYRASTPSRPTLNVFGGLQRRRAPIAIATTNDGARTAITFTRFVKEILPAARKIEFKLPEKDNIYFFLTGLPNSAPLMQWHTPDNLGSWFVNAIKRPVEIFNLAAGWVQVPYIVAFPNMWPDLATLTSSSETSLDRTKPLCGSLPSDEEFATFKHKHHSIHYLVGLSGAQRKSSSLCLFPSFLKTELHGVRSTIEAYSKRGTVERQETGKDAVAGIEIAKSVEDKLGDVFRITDSKDAVETYELTYWE